MTRRNKGKATNNSNNNNKRKRKEADATVGLKEEEKMNNNNEENGNNGADDDVNDAADANDLDNNNNNNNNKAEDFTEDFLTLGGLSDDDDDDNDDAEEATASKSNNRQKYVINSSSNNNSRIDLPPWMNTYVDYRRTNYLVSLHNEIVSFCHLMEPRPTELQQRQNLVDAFTKLALSVFKDCQVNVFGSQVTGLCLPTSDIDISIQLSEADTPKEEKEKDDNRNNKHDKDKKPAAAAKGGGGEKKVISKEQELKDMENWDAQTSSSPLQRLGDKLREEWIDDLSYLEIIENTRVPLVKFTHGPTNISIDVCFNQTSGPQAAKLMFQYMDALPPLRPLTFVMKYFTESRALNQPYTGGIGSYMLQLMIVAFLQHRERETRAARQPSIYNLGALLIEFLEFYCTDFNYVTTGISVRYDGHFFRKGAVDRKDQFWMSNRPFSLAMENPLEPDMDVGASSFRISVIQRSFEVAFKTILCHVTEPLVPTTSILAAILPPTEEMKQRAFDQRRTTTTATTASQKTTPPKTTSMLDSALAVPRGSPIKNNDNRRGSSGSSSRRRSSGSISPRNNNSSGRGSGGSNSGRPRKRQRRQAG